MSMMLSVAFSKKYPLNFLNNVAVNCELRTEIRSEAHFFIFLKPCTIVH